MNPTRTPATLMIHTTRERHAEAVILAHAHAPIQIGKRRGVAVVCRRGKPDETHYWIHRTANGGLVVTELEPS